MRRTVGALLVLLLTSGAAQAVARSVAVGVIAPLTGRSARAGYAHESSTEWGLERLQYVVQGPGGLVEVRLVVRDDRGDEAEAARVAEELVTQLGVVAILGPVNSASTLAV